MPFQYAYRNRFIPLSTTKDALGPISIATAPAPPDGRALPAAYTAISAQTTTASRPGKYLIKSVMSVEHCKIKLKLRRLIY